MTPMYAAYIIICMELTALENTFGRKMTFDTLELKAVFVSH